jgi:hypothetical protein
MFKKPTLSVKKGLALDIPLFKPISTYEPKHYIKKLARKIKVALDSLDFDSILNEDKEEINNHD